MRSRGEVTRVTLVETAERLFAERGIESVSLRDVCAAAGQRNHSAAQYHFGDRAGLVAAVYEHRMRLVNERRRTMLDAVDPDDATGIVRAVVEPLAGVVDETGGWYGRFLARTQWDTFARSVLVELPVLSSYRRACDLVAARLAAGLGGLSRRQRLGRIEQMGTLVIGTVASREWQRHRGEAVLPLAAFQDDLVATTAAAVFAPVATAARMET